MTYDSQNYNPSNLAQLNRVEPAYLGAYGLTEAPFSIQHDDRYLYLNPALTERLELLKHYTQYGNLLLIITGERGIGKSSLKQRFINNAQEEWQICEIQSHTMMDASQLLKQIAHGFNITEPPLEPSALFEVLSVQLEYIRQASYVPILIIDDAHELPQDALQALLYLAEHHSDQETALRIILFCEPEIEIMLDDPAIHSLRERVTHSMKMAALDETETAEYLRHRLAVAGLDGTSPFTPKLVHKIFKASEGIPAKINDYAHQNLLDDSEPFGSEEMDLKNELIQETRHLNARNMLLGGFALAIAITVLFFQDHINSLFEEPAPAIVETQTIQNKVTEEDKQTSPEITAGSKNILGVETPPGVKPAEEKTIEFSLNEKPTEKIISQAEPVASTKEAPAAIILSKVNPSPVPTSKQRQIISISGTGFNKRQKVKVSWAEKQKILSDNQVTFTSDTFINLILNVGMQSDTWEVSVIDPELNIKSNTISFDVVSPEKEKISTPAKIVKQEKTAPIAIAPTTPTILSPQLKAKRQNGIYGINWIKQQNKNHFTLQLLGTHQESTLPEYLEEYALKNDAASFKTKRDGKDWFTLIYGAYPTKAAAQTAVNQLPKGIETPWVRSFASILPSLTSEPDVIHATTEKLSSTIPGNQEGWLWSQDPRHYTLQLIAGSDKKAVEAFIKRHNLKGKAAFFHQLRDGKDWYILIYGSYSSYSKAKNAINQLPLVVQQAKPWARNFSAIHAELN